MAIQIRRGNYADLNTSRLVAGELFTTLDPSPDGDYMVGLGISPSTTVRLATYTNLQTVLADCEQYAKDAKESADEADISEANALDSAKYSESYAVGGTNTRVGEDTDNSKYYKEQANYYWDLIDNAMTLIRPSLTLNMTTGRVEYNGSFFDFKVNYVNGHLEWGVAV